MGPHLYTVDPDGEATLASVPTGSGTEGGHNQRAAWKARPKYPVPTDRLKFETQVLALRTICLASRGGEEIVTAEKMAANMGLAATTAPLNNAFYVSLALVEKIGKGGYKPTPLALRFQQKWSFTKDEAGPILAPAFQESWFYRAVRLKLEITPKTTREQMIETLAGEAETDDSYATQYGFLLQWLEYVGLLTTRDGYLVLAATDEDLGDSEVPDTETEAYSAGDPKREVIGKTVIPESRPRPILTASFDFSLSPDDLAKLTPEQIEAVFDGARKLAVIQAVLKGD
jgi:hypothetical protein